MRPLIFCGWVLGSWAVVTIFIFGVAAIPVFYRCRIAETASCMYEPNFAPEVALSASSAIGKKRN